MANKDHNPSEAKDQINFHSSLAQDCGSVVSPKATNDYNQIVQNLHRNQSLTISNNNYTSSSIRQKLFHRFSDAPSLGRRKKKKNSERSCYSMSDTIEIFADPVYEDKGERSSWEYHTVSVTRVPGYGFGIAVSGGRDNPHFANGDPSIAVSDVLKGGPAEDKLQVNDRIVSVNGVNLENVEYATAVQVLRDSGNTVTLVVKRRVTSSNTISSHQPSQIINAGIQGINSSTTSTVNPITLQTHQEQAIRVTLTKSNKKDDFGIVLGCRLFIKEISSKTRDQLLASGYSLAEGDIITRIQNTNCSDSMNLKEAKKIIDSCKERLNLVVLRDITSQSLNNSNNLNNLGGGQSGGYSHSQPIIACNNNLDEPYISGVRYSSQNLYVQPPTRGGCILSPNDEKNNLTPRGRSRGPLMDVSLSQLDRPSTPLNENHEPPRPPPPRTEDYYGCRRQLYDDDPLQRSRQSVEPRFISFQKEGSVGIRLTGGNEAGIFVTAVQPGSPASLQGLTPGDKILKVNDMDMHGVTREEAVLFLLSLQDRIDLIVQYCKDEYEEVVANQRGDSFHIKTHFHCDNPSKGEMAFKAGDVFRVIDTLHNGVVGSWQVLKIGRGHQEMQRGVIPNKSRAEELATAQFNATKKELNTSESRGNFFRRRRTHRRSKSLSKENWDDVVFSDSISKFPAYERVVLRHPGFVRPVVLFGPISDISRDKLTKDFPDKFTVPLQDDDKSGSGKSRIVRLSNIRDIMDRGKHALLDITPNAVDRLNYAQLYPIVIFLKADSKHVIKQLRQGLPKSVHKSSKKLFEQCQKLEKIWSHIFSTTIMLNETDMWYKKLREAIDLQQSGAVWMSESKPVESLSDDFLFPMTTSRLSYASSPESDLELSPGPSTSLSLGNLPQLIKSSSDPSIATNQDNADRDRDIIGEGLPPPYTHHFDHSNPARLTNTSLMDNKYNFSSNNQTHSSTTQDNNTMTPPHRIPSLYGINPPDLPPRIDRASKPLLSTSSTNTIIVGNNHTNNLGSSSVSSGGGGNRSTQESVYGKQLSADDVQNEYLTRHNIDSIERTHNSLERQRVGTAPGTPSKTATVHPAQNGYDSVSSYESYNTTQLCVQNIRLGPNAPDDLKSVPNVSARHLPSSATVTNTCDYRSPHDHNLRGFSGINDLNIQNSPGRPSLHDISTNRNIETRNTSNIQQGINVPPQRPTNLSLESSPRKHILETKTDYGKYSRSNSASQADYSKTMKTHSIPPPPPSNLSIGNGNGGNGSNIPFKPVPPPKPKNYRPPTQGQVNAGNWDNGEQSPQSPNGFFYPSTQSHYHHSQTVNSGSPHNGVGSGSGIQNYTHCGTGQVPHQPLPSSNGYKNNQHYNSPYVHRGHPPLSNLPIHSPERQALDLAGSREQRGSAFELYRKPQIGNVGHHHNVREMESNEQYYRPYHISHQMQRSNRQTNEYDYQQQNNNIFDFPPPLPKKEKKKSMLKNSLSTFKNVLIKTTRPLRRMTSMVEPERKLKPCLRRQHSMMEHRITSKYPFVTNNYFPQRSPSLLLSSAQQNFNVYHNRGLYYSENINSTYGNLSDDTYRPVRSKNEGQENFDDLYANRALIDLERRKVESKSVGRRIIRRHSMAERSTSSYYSATHEPQQNVCEYENSYCNYQNSHSLNEKRAPGSEIMMRRRFNSNEISIDEPIYKSRMEMHRIHLYQSRKEMQERIAQGKREIEREFNNMKMINSKSDDILNEDTIYKSKQELKYKTNSPLHFKDHIYQSQKGAIETMTESVNISRRGIIKHEPIYETREECVMSSKENITDEKKEEKYDNSADGTLTPDSKPSEHSNETVIENYKTESASTNDRNLNQSCINISSNVSEIYKTPFHISSIIKRTAPVLPPNGNTSITSIETHYTSQASLPVGPPKASSTPYASDIFLPSSVAAVEAFLIKPNSPPKETRTTKGVFDENGGTLIDNIWNVSLHIPAGALPAGAKQEIYFTVSDPRIGQMISSPPLDMENGETMLSPLVMCGPQGLEFLIPVTLNIPHCGGRTVSLGLSLKATDSEKSLHTNWDNIDLPSNTAAHTVSVKVDHF